jgi:hypothetical protein
MCKRYGWSFNSPMAARYIDRSGVMEKETARIIRSDEVGELKMKVSRQEVESKVMKENFDAALEKQRQENQEILKKLEKEEEQRKKAEEDKVKKEKEINWDNMVFERMVKNPKLVPRMLKAFEKVWKEKEQEGKSKQVMGT